VLARFENKFECSILHENCKLQKPYFLNTKIRQILEGGRIKQVEQLYFWDEVKIPNGILITKSGSESSLNLLRVQTFGGKSG
jgi:hypothetical protein